MMESTTKKKSGAAQKAILFLCLLAGYFFVFSFYGGRLAESVFLADTVFSEKTFIGTEDVSGKSRLEAARLLNEKTADWQNSVAITGRYAEKEAGLTSSLIAFQIEQSVEQAADGQKNPLVADVAPDVLEEELDRKMPSIPVKEKLDLELLASDIADLGRYLKAGKSELDLALYVPEKERSSKIAEVVEKGLDQPAADFIQQNPSMAVKGGTAVSFNSWIEPSGDKISEESLNILSSALYRLVLHTNFPIMEKNQSTDLPEYITLGYEAKVQKNKQQDFVFLNPNANAYSIRWTVANGNVYGVLTGVPFYYTYKPELKNKETLAPKTVLHFSPDLPYGTMQVEQYGENGMMIDIYRHRMEGSKTRNSEQIAADFYPPEHQVELYSSKEPPEPEPEEAMEKEEAGTATNSTEDEQ